MNICKRGGKRNISKLGVKKCSRQAGRKGCLAKFSQASQREEELMQKWRKDGKSMGDIHLLIGRSKDTISKHTDNAQPRPEKSGLGAGRPRRWMMRFLLAL